MAISGQIEGGTGIVPALGFVAVLDPKGRAEVTLKAILPDLAIGGYHSRSTETLAMAADASKESITVTSVDQRDVILLGNMVSEVVEPEETLDWAVSTVVNGRYGELKTLQGVFALVVVDWVEQTVTVVSDLLGIKPFYVANREGVTILSDRAEAAPRLGGAQIDALGMAGWLYFSFPLVNRTMFKSVARIAPASVTVYDRQSSRQERYWTPTVAEEPISADELADRVYHDFAASLRRLLRPYKAATVLLSGGFDSRLCLLTVLRENLVRLDAVTVPFSQAERDVVDQLVHLTGVPCERVEAKKSIWDESDSMWYSHPDGYWRLTNLSYRCAKHSGKSNLLVDGFHSDTVLRSDRAGPHPKGAVTQDEALEYVWNIHRFHNPEWCFRSRAINRVERLARQAADEQSDAFEWNAKFCLQWDIYTDERRNMAANHLQYAHFAPSVQPFYSRALMEKRLRYANEMFTMESYRALLKRQFPGAGGLPHSKDLPTEKFPKYLFSWALWRQLPSIARFVHRHRDVLRSRWILPRMLGYGFRRRRHTYVVMELMRFVKLEEEMNRLGIEVDFRQLS